MFSTYFSTHKNLSLQSINDDIRDIEKQVNLVKRELDSTLTYHESTLYIPKDQLFIQKLQEFHKELYIKFSILKREQEKLTTEIKNVFSFFGEDKDTKLTPEQLIGYMQKFFNAFDNALIQHKQSLKKVTEILTIETKNTNRTKVNNRTTGTKVKANNQRRNCRNPSFGQFAGKSEK